MVTVRSVLLSTATKHICYEGGRGTYVVNTCSEPFKRRLDSNCMLREFGLNLFLS